MPNQKHIRTCPVCQTVFSTNAYNRKYCSDICAKQVYDSIRHTFPSKNNRTSFEGYKYQPPGTQILTVKHKAAMFSKATLSQTPIENIQVGDIVYSYSPNDGHFYSSVAVSSCLKTKYSGTLITASLSNGNRSSFKPTHQCIASFDNFRDKHWVYLMRRGNQFRIGVSSIKEDSSGPAARLHHEGGDAMWLLQFYDTRQDALVMEAAISGRFGLPQLVFNSTPCTTPGIAEIAWKFIGDNTHRAINCLDYYQKNISYPLFHIGYRIQLTLKRPMPVHACNLFSGCLMLSCNGREDRFRYKHNWMPISISTQPYTGYVYSIDVEKYHTYVADGITT